MTTRFIRQAVLGGVLATLAPAAVGAGAQAATRTIATVNADTPISAYHGLLVYSARAGAAEQFSLMAHENGVTKPVPIATRSVPFDVDLGPDAQGHTVAVYSRCAHEPALRGPAFTGTAYEQGTACRLYSYDFASGLERRLGGTPVAGASEDRPTIWRSQIASCASIATTR